MICTVDGGFTAADIVNITGGILNGDLSGEITRLTLDSRDKNEGGLFVAVRGERFDGHDFIAEAIKNGAVCYLTSRHDPVFANAAAVYVEDTVQALGALANAHRRRINPVTVAVTGSVGKTTTRQFIFSVLNQKYRTHKTEGNFNNDIGLPLTLLRLTRRHNAAVLEFGMSGPGEIAGLSRMAEPDIAVITNIGNSHIEYLHSRENIRDAKMEIIHSLRPGGKLFLNGSEPLLAGVNGAIYVAFKGSGPGSDISIDAASSGIEGSTFDLTAFGAKLRGLEIPAVGRHNIYNAAVACGVGLSLGMDEKDIRRGLGGFENIAMRQNIYKSGGKTIIEDCYNASPESMASSLEVLGSVARQNGGRSIAVLGDMRELGRWSESLHLGVGRMVADMHTDLLFTLGGEAMLIAEGAIKAGMNADSVYRFEDISDIRPLTAALKDRLREGDNLLFKASRSVELERVTAALDER
ncbi:MAG: UDP-N-acetylmuramoyl-tripeptide--D-alanyl-D-alanine ligase [Eubacteriales bacterium]|nr:UDP-N-acetylmuramoyl-tripeptide--D-alanyl-D-alanine ligase [Eubacteriales bacterium]